MCCGCKLSGNLVLNLNHKRLYKYKLYLYFFNLALYKKVYFVSESITGGAKNDKDCSTASKDTKRPKTYEEDQP